MSSAARSMLLLAILSLAVTAAGCNTSLPRNAPLLPGNAPPGSWPAARAPAGRPSAGVYREVPSPSPSSVPAMSGVHRRPVAPAIYRAPAGPVGAYRTPYPVVPMGSGYAPARAPVAAPPAPLAGTRPAPARPSEEKEPTPEQIVQPGHGNPIDPARPMTIDEFIEWQGRQRAR